MTLHTLNHSEFLARIDTFLAGGLVDELKPFMAHRDGCPSCAAALAEAQAADAQLRLLFESAHPKAGFEDRLIESLRFVDHRPERRLIHPAVRRVATGVAAAILVLAIGYEGEKFLNPAKSVDATGLVSELSVSMTVPDSDRYGIVNGRSPEGVELQQKTEARPLASSEYFAATLGGRLRENLGREKTWKDSGGENGVRVLTEYDEKLGDAANKQLATKLDAAVSELKAYEEQAKGRFTQVETNSAMSLKAAQHGAATAVDGLGARKDGGVPASKPQTPALQNPNGTVAQRAGVAFEEKDSALLPTDDNGITAPKGGSGGGGASKDQPPVVLNYIDKASGIPVQTGTGGKSDGEKSLFGVEGWDKKSAPAPGGYALPEVRYYRNAGGAEPDVKRLSEPSNSDTHSLQIKEAEGKTILGVKGLEDTTRGRGEGGETADKLKVQDFASLAKNESAQGPAGESAPTAGDKPALKTEVVAGEEPRPVAAPAVVAADDAQPVTPDAPKIPVPKEPAKPNVATVARPDPGAQLAPAVRPDETRKIIRNGEMTFEVDSFDTAYLTIARIAQEETGFVATTDSEKLANGKVRGSVIVRVPPGHLDTLVLKLRALGELKNSKIAAQDVTKQYTDLSAQLRAANTMEARLLEIIKTGKGTVKELLEAEKQRGVWREKIERLEGEIRYYDNMISLSTLTLTLMERDIRHAALLEEREQVQMNVETDDVEKSRTSAIQAIDQAKGRIIGSELRRHDAGQFTAMILADVAPDAAPGVIDRLKQIGRVSRLEIDRKQTTPGGNVDANNNNIPPLPNAKVERKDTRLTISLYNLANIEPRQTSSLNLAADDVEKAYAAVLEQAKTGGGRILTSQLIRPRPDTTTGTIVFETASDKADAVLAAVRGAAEVMRLDVQQNPDTQNTTDAKKKFVVQIVSLAVVPARESTQLTVATRKVSDSFSKVRDSVREAQGRILTSQVSQANGGQFSATADLVFEIPREGYTVIEKNFTESGQVVSRQVTRSNDAENTVDSKIRLQIRFVDEAQLNPGESVTVNIAAADVNAQFGKLLEAVRGADARVLDSKLNEAEKENVTGTITFEMRRAQRQPIEKALTESGDVINRNVDTTHGAPNTTLEDKVRFSVTLTDADRLPPRQTVRMGMESDDVDKSTNNVRNAVLGAGGRTVSAEQARERNGKTISHIVMDVPLSQAMTVLAKVGGEGTTTSRQDSHNAQVPDGKLARVRIDLTIDNGSRIVEADQTFGSTIRKGLSTSITGLLNALYYLVIGIFLIFPIVLLVWIIVKIVRRNMRPDRRPGTPPAVSGGPTPTPA